MPPNIFVDFTDADRDIAIERFTFPVTGGAQLPFGSEPIAVRVLTISHRAFANHNGGQLQFGLDGATRNLYIADVGRGSREEVDVVAASAAGLNCGWNIWEGTICYPAGTACNHAGITMPLIDYDHGDGCSITGGYVYRGSALPEIAGRYFYSDFCNGWLRSFLVAGGVAIERTDWGVTPVGNIQSFGLDSRNEL